MMVPTRPKIYHIVHVNKLTSIIRDGHIWCDAEMARRAPAGTVIGMSSIKQRRMELRLASHSGLYVADCTPFYFCPRSVMLFLIHRDNHPDLTYHGGQEPIVHLEADLYDSIAWAQANSLRWAFTLSNAGSYYFEDRCNVDALSEINWEAVQSTSWSMHKEAKQAEFLMEQCFPWPLVERIGVCSLRIQMTVSNFLASMGLSTPVSLMPSWYY